jgi:hypothetical protein
VYSFIHSFIHLSIPFPHLTYFSPFLIPSLIHFRITVLASNRNSGLKALRNSLDHVTEDLGCGVRCAMLLDFPNTIRYVYTYTYTYTYVVSLNCLLIFFISCKILPDYPAFYFISFLYIFISINSSIFAIINITVINIILTSFLSSIFSFTTSQI